MAPLWVSKMFTYIFFYLLLKLIAKQLKVKDILLAFFFFKLLVDDLGVVA